MTRPSWEPASAFLAALVLAASLAWFMLAERAPVLLPGAGSQGGSPACAGLAMPAIGGFENFDVNNDNPFVPWRDRERTALRPPGGGAPPPQPPAGVDPPRGRPLVLPTAAPGGGDIPAAIGYVRGSGIADGVLVDLPGEKRPRSMRPGERVGRWTFMGIETGNVALFADEAGRQYRLVIGAR